MSPIRNKRARRTSSPLSKDDKTALSNNMSPVRNKRARRTSSPLPMASSSSAADLDRVMNEVLELKEANARLAADLRSLQAVVSNNYSLLRKSFYLAHQRVYYLGQIDRTQKRIDLLKHRLRETHHDYEDEDEPARTFHSIEEERQMLRRELRRLSRKRRDFQLELGGLDDQAEGHAWTLGAF